MSSLRSFDDDRHEAAASQRATGYALIMALAGLLALCVLVALVIGLWPS